MSKSLKGQNHQKAAASYSFPFSANNGGLLQPSSLGSRNPSGNNRKGLGQKGGRHSSSQLEVLPATELHWQILIILYAGMYLFVQIYSVHGTRFGEANFIAVRPQIF